jgi:hypothetical protein
MTARTLTDIAADLRRLADLMDDITESVLETKAVIGDTPAAVIVRQLLPMASRCRTWAAELTDHPP